MPHHQLKVDIHNPLGINPVVKNRIRCSIFTGRNSSDFFLEGDFRRIKQIVQISLKRIYPQPCYQLLQLPAGKLAGSYHGLDILFDDRQADVGKDQIPNITAQPTLLINFNRGYAQGFLPYFPGSRIIPARYGSAHVGLVSVNGSKADEFVFPENRFYDFHIRSLIASGKGVIMHDHITGMEVVAIILGNGFNGGRDRISHYGDKLTLLPNSSIHTVDTGTEIASFTEVERTAAKHHGHGHLAGNGFQFFLHQGGSNRIHNGLIPPIPFKFNLKKAYSCFMTKQLPSQNRAKPDGTTIVE